MPHRRQLRTAPARALSLAVAVTLGTGQASCRPRDPAFIPAGTVADAPIGFTAMCARDHMLCAAGLPIRDEALPKEGAAAGGAEADLPGFVNGDAVRDSASGALADRCLNAPSHLALGLEPRSAGVQLASLVLMPELVPPPGLVLQLEVRDTSCAEGGLGISRTALQRTALSALPAPVPAVTPFQDDPAVQSRLIRAINADVNRHIVRASDMVTAGVEERWQRPAVAGDCEDLAIEKRIRLIAAGFPPSHLFYVVAFRHGLGLHTMLIARLADGDYVLDSLSPRVLPWAKVSYSWLRQQSPENPLLWMHMSRPASVRRPPARFPLSPEETDFS